MLAGSSVAVTCVRSWRRVIVWIAALGWSAAVGVDSGIVGVSRLDLQRALCAFFILFAQAGPEHGAAVFHVGLNVGEARASLGGAPA